MRKAIKLPIMINPVMGKHSAQYLAFSKVSWGKLTCLFIKSTKNVDNMGMEKIMNEAKELAQVSCNKDKADNDIDPEDDHANLQDKSDGTLSNDDQALPEV